MKLATWGCASVLCSAAVLMPLLVDTDPGSSVAPKVRHAEAMPIARTECSKTNASWRLIVPPTTEPYDAGCAVLRNKMDDAR